MAGRSRLGTATRLQSTADRRLRLSSSAGQMLLRRPAPPATAAAAAATTTAAAGQAASQQERRRHGRHCGGGGCSKEHTTPPPLRSPSPLLQRRGPASERAQASTCGRPHLATAGQRSRNRLRAPPRARSATTAERREVVPFAIFDGDAVHWRARHSLCQASRHRRRSTQTSQTRIPNGTHRRTGTQSQTPRPTHALIHKNTLTTYSLSHTQTQTQTPTQTQTQTHTHLRQAKDKQRGRVVRLEAGPPHRRQQLPRLGPPSLCGGSDGTGVALAGSRPSAAAGANAITPRTAQTPYFFLQRRGAGEGMSDTGIKRSHQTVAEPL